MEENDVDYVDKWSMVAMALLLIIFHIMFATFIYRTVTITYIHCIYL